MTIKNYLPNFIGIPVAMLGILAITHSVKAQTAMKKPPSAVVIDGSIGEWGTLAMYDSDSKTKYTLSNDDTCLYFALYTISSVTKRKIMMAGITISINTEGKKRRTYSLTYPQPRHRADDGSMPVAAITTSGFKGMEANVPAIKNSYGLKAAAKTDEDGGVGYEMAIPLKLLNLKPDKSNDLFVNVSINGVEQSPERKLSEGGDAGASTGRTSGNVRGGVRSSSSGTPAPSSYDDSGMSESQDFWVKLTFAK